MCGDEGVIEAVVKAINTHINNASVCENGFGALMNMAKYNGKNTEITKNKSINENEQMRTK